MTREERLTLLKQIEKDIHVCSLESTFLEDAKSCAIRSVIDELEREPCEDCISRQAALSDDGLSEFHYYEDYAKMRNYLRSLPSVNPQEPKIGWIPVSERLPEDGTWNIFTNGKQISVERYKTDALDHFFPSGRWFSLEDTIAWMPLPEPYKAESEE